MSEDTEPTVESRRLYQGRVLGLRVDTVRLRGGRVATREVVEHPGSVCIVPVDAQERVLLVRQYRKAVGQALLEVPAGSMEPGESAVASAQRELEEETGYRAGTVTEMGSFYTSPGFCTEVMHAFLATELVRGQMRPEWDEEIQVVPTPLSGIPEMVRQGELRDGKSIASLLLALGRLGKASSLGL